MDVLLGSVSYLQVQVIMNWDLLPLNDEAVVLVDDPLI
jgi:hypothetical protein